MRKLRYILCYTLIWPDPNNLRASILFGESMGSTVESTIDQTWFWSVHYHFSIKYYAEFLTYFLAVINIFHRANHAKFKRLASLENSNRVKKLVLTCKMCSSLSLTPPEKIDNGWVSTVSKVPTTAKLGKFLDYLYVVR